MKKENYSAEELDSWGLLAQARKERKRSKTIENENVEDENKEKRINQYLEKGILSQEMLNRWTKERA